MAIIQFAGLPLPHYIHSGFSLAGPGRKHPERYAVGEFDLLVVKQGCMYIGEEDRRYEVSEGHALILRPDLHHYPTEGCRTATATYWLHFHTLGGWRMRDEESVLDNHEEAQAADRDSDGTSATVTAVTAVSTVTKAAEPNRSFRVPEITLEVPQFTRLLRPAEMYDKLQQLHMHERDNHQSEVRFEQQLLFQEVLRQLSASAAARTPKAPGAETASRAASYLRERYRSRVTAEELGAALSFHPVYIARCMQKQFGCSPMEYLLLYRLEQAKQLLLETDLSINQIAEEVGFQQPAYFAACFRKREGRTPREHRQQFIRR
ncbi:helix-turn-helix transcriptional regulator [Paenibacillus harenae]|uniref:helix-turn-helix transcriptional regulator n=1 Tax=Paenibacillus harenae TaxID=306543 RepID=UPI00278CF0EE|nr:AraC family transcriptional regulator [Paenibacillus harenae]MDQ0061829.1 AraC-like DNA-binding protein [Paenibacillus harenae]